MSNYNGEDMLNVFENLHVSIGNLNPVVIKAWFDTDDTNMRYFLDWMCASLSSCNYLPPQQETEFNELEEPLYGTKYEKELDLLQQRYPDILDVEENTFDIELLEDELELMKEEEKKLEDLLKSHRTIEKQLTIDEASLNETLVKSDLRCEEIQNKCFELSGELDSTNEEVFQNINKYATNLNNLNLGHSANFITKEKLNKFEDDIDTLSSHLKVFLKYNPPTALDLKDSSVDPLDDDPSNDKFMEARNRIYNTYHKHLSLKFEEEKLRKVWHYLVDVRLSEVKTVSESALLESLSEEKIEQKKCLCKLIDKLCSDYANYSMKSQKLLYAKSKLELYEKLKKYLESVKESMITLFSHQVLLNYLYYYDQVDVKGLDRFFRKTLQYTSKDLVECIQRTEKMNEIINKYEDYNSKPLGEIVKVVGYISKLLSNSDNLTLNSVAENVSNFNNELSAMEVQVFDRDLEESKKESKQFVRNLKVLYKFLVCGPTHRIVSIPNTLHLVLQDIDRFVKEQTSAVQKAVDVSLKMKNLSKDKWKNYRRQLWMYFLTDPQKLFSILHEAEAEFKNKLSIKEI